MEEKLKALEGITEADWKILKEVIDTRFYHLSQKNTFNVDEGTLEHLKILAQ